MTRILWSNELHGFSMIEVAASTHQILEQLQTGKPVIPGLDLRPPYLVYCLEGLIVISRNSGDPGMSPGRLMPIHPSPRLTRREKAVVQALADGLTVKEMGLQLGIKPRTVLGYIGALKVKFKAQTREQLVGQAVAMGLCTVQPVNRVPSDATT